jgi:hypothetical protein
MSPKLKSIMDRVAAWPEEDLAKLEDAACAIEESRSGDYHASAEELQALDEAEGSGIASGEDVEAAFKTFRPA